MSGGRPDTARMEGATKICPTKPTGHQKIEFASNILTTSITTTHRPRETSQGLPPPRYPAREKPLLPNRREPRLSPSRPACRPPWKSIGFIGFPSVGKSTLMSKLTGQHSEAAAYEFTTLTSVPGQVVYNGAPLQIIDLPGIIEGAKDGRGRGRQVIAVAKTCHLIFIVLDVNKPLTDKRVIEAELEGFGIRINKSPPNITFRKKDKGGLNVTSTVPLTHIDHDEIKAVMSEYRINSADITIRCDATVDDLIDVLEAKSRSYIPVVYCLNKIDSISIEELDLLYRIPNAVPISSEHGWNIDELMEAMWDKLSLKRVYTKPKGKAPDYSAPVVLRATRCTVEDFCNAIHRSIVEQFKTAIVYGKSVKHQPQRVGLAHELEDEDVDARAAMSGGFPSSQDAIPVARARATCAQFNRCSSAAVWSRRGSSPAFQLEETAKMTTALTLSSDHCQTMITYGEPWWGTPLDDWARPGWGKIATTVVLRRDASKPDRWLVHQMRWRLGLGRPGLPAWLLTDLVNCGRQPKKKGRQRGGISPTVHAMAGAVAADLDGGSQYPWATVAHGYHIDDNLAITARIDDSDPGGLRLWQGPGRAGPDPGPK
ncbi:hypothetical protein PCL_08158 [Purpureocillium lilacinum]|uniref:OBG-type G domain-containing protein n=1 Tax=Purpureocillium lilacinum TaxID=33203 RepID=A0A2U3EJZ7_PURLI|nr:hypothetical protein PCL_08158 [Purpureocillium lilacinum]